MSQDNQPQGDREQEDSDGTRAIWTKRANKLLLGRKIVKVEYMPVKESDDMMWDYQPVCFLLDNGSWIYPMKDDEGNDGGVLAVGQDMLPVLRGDK